MRRLPLLDIVLFLVLAPLWLGCFTLHVHEVLRGRLAWVPVVVSLPEQPDSYPVVRAFWPGTGAEASGLASGDQLVRLGNTELQGVGPLGFVARAYEEANSELRVRIAFLRAGERHETALRLTPVTFPWRILLLTLGCAVTAVFVLLRASGSRAARLFFLAGMAYSFHWMFFFGGPRLQTYVWIVIFLCSSVVTFPLILRAALIFPEEIAPTGMRMPVWPWLFAILGLSEASWIFGVPFSSTFGLRAIFVVTVLFITTLLVILTRNYRQAGPIGRRQLKWVVYGFYIGVFPVLVTNVVIALDPSLWWMHELSMIAPVFIPICLGIAIIRYNLFDIDRLISTTAASSILLIFLIGGALLGGPQLARAMSGVVRFDQTSEQSILQLLLVVLVAPGQRYLRPWIERWFFPERQALQHGIDQLLQELSLSEHPQTFLTLISERLYALLQSDSCVAYRQVDKVYTPIFVRGSAVPSVIAVKSPLVEALHAQVAPIDIERWRSLAGRYLTPKDRAALESLRAVVVLPIGRDEPPAAFICLGRKRSGDIYTPIDYALLAAVTDKVADEPLRFDEEEIHRRAAKEEALRFPARVSKPGDNQ